MGGKAKSESELFMCKRKSEEWHACVGSGFGLASNDLHTHKTAGPSQCKETPETASALRITTWTISLQTKPLGNSI